MFISSKAKYQLLFNMQKDIIISHTHKCMHSLTFVANHLNTWNHLNDKVVIYVYINDILLNNFKTLILKTSEWENAYTDTLRKK